MTQEKEEKLWRTIYMAGERREKHLVPHIKKHLNFPAEKIRSQALMSLCLLGDKEALSLAEVRARDNSLSKQERSLALWAMRKHPDCDPLLYQQLKKETL